MQPFGCQPMRRIVLLDDRRPLRCRVRSSPMVDWTPRYRRRAHRRPHRWSNSIQRRVHSWAARRSQRGSPSNRYRRNQAPRLLRPPPSRLRSRDPATRRVAHERIEPGPGPIHIATTDTRALAACSGRRRQALIAVVAQRRAVLQALTRALPMRKMGTVASTTRDERERTCRQGHRRCAPMMAGTLNHDTKCRQGRCADGGQPFDVSRDVWRTARDLRLFVIPRCTPRLL